MGNAGRCPSAASAVSPADLGFSPSPVRSLTVSSVFPPIAGSLYRTLLLSWSKWCFDPLVGRFFAHNLIVPGSLSRGAPPTAGLIFNLFSTVVSSFLSCCSNSWNFASSFSIFRIS